MYTGSERVRACALIGGELVERAEDARGEVTDVRVVSVLVLVVGAPRATDSPAAAREEEARARRRGGSRGGAEGRLEPVARVRARGRGGGGRRGSRGGGETPR